MPQSDKTPQKIPRKRGPHIAGHLCSQCMYFHPTTNICVKLASPQKVEGGGVFSTCSVLVNMETGPNENACGLFKARPPEVVE